MISDLDIAASIQNVYNGNRDLFVKFVLADHNGICWALQDVGGGYYLLILRGSADREDWDRDFNAVANPFSHAKLGPLHPGFNIGMESLAATVIALGIDVSKLIVAGHSLGAGRACILIGYLIIAGHPPCRRVCFGEPRPGFIGLANVILQVPAASYRNAGPGGHDLVTDAPLKLLLERYVHPAPLIDVCAPPQDDIKKELGIFAWHHMPLYMQGLQSQRQ